MGPASARNMLACGWLAFGSGCASDRAMEKLHASRTAVEHAVMAGAAELAPHDLALSRTKIALGERWVGAGDHEPAHWLAEQARVDAELAALKAGSARAEQTAAAARRDGAPRRIVVHATQRGN